MFRHLVVLFSVICSLSVYASGYHSTENYYKCYNRQSGVWKMGQGGFICDLDPFMPVKISRELYSPLIFDVRNGRVIEQTRYANEAYAFLKDLAQWYLFKRSPNASLDELDGWTNAVFAMGMQETYWSHYRIQGKFDVQLVRGDSGHGHGMFQIDDRWHFDAIENGIAANLVRNVVYGLDIYYDGWRQSAKAKCIKSPTDYYNRARAAYSAFNGGSGKICRWTNPNDKWASNDIQFKGKLDEKVWWNYITNTNIENKINIPCIAAGGKNCGGDYEAPVVKDVELFGVYPIGSFIKLNKNINFRSTPGGALIGTFKKNSTYQVLGIEKSRDGSSGRYYHLGDGNNFGYIFAGNNSTYVDWCTVGNAKDATKFIFLKGDKIVVKDQILTIKKSEVTKNNTLFYICEDEQGNEVQVSGGYLGNDIVLSSSVQEYVEPVYPTARLRSNVYYAHVKKSKKLFAKNLLTVKGPKLDHNARFEVLEISKKWAKVRIDGIQGYIKVSKLEIER